MHAINHGIHRSRRLSAAIRHLCFHRSLICIMIVLMAGEFGISRTRTRDVHCLDIWLLLQFRGVFFFSVESTMPIKIKTAGCCRSIGSMPVARISKWIRPRISPDGDENRAVGRRGEGGPRFDNIRSSKRRWSRPSVTPYRALPVNTIFISIVYCVTNLRTPKPLLFFLLSAQ